MCNLRSVEKFSFKEKRFLNQVAEGGGSKPEAAKPAVVAQPGAVEAGAVVPAKPGEGGVDGNKAEIIDRKTGDLTKLQDELTSALKKSPDEYEAQDQVLLQKYLDEIGKISGVELKRSVSVSKIDFDAIKNNNKNGLYQEIYKVYLDKKADFSSFAKMFGITAEDPKTLEKSVMAIVSMGFANSFVNKGKEGVKTKYKHLDEFLKTDAGKAFSAENIDAKFKYDSKAGVSVDLAGSDKFETDYAEFAKTKPVEDQKPVDAAKAAEALPVEQRVAYLAASPIGKILKMFGYGKKVDGVDNAGFKKVLDGSDPLVAGILVFLGFGEKLGLGSFDELVGSLPDVGGLKANLIKMHEQAKKNPKFGVAGVDESKLKLGEVQPKAPMYEVYDEVKFLEKVKKGEALDPAKDGIKVDKELKLGEGDKPKNVKVDLSSGGEIVVDGGNEGVKLVVNGKDVSVAKGTVLRLGKDSADGEIKAKGGVAVLSGTIPVGVVFTKTCKLSEEKVEVAAK